MIKVGERVECIEKKSMFFGQKGTFTGWLANGLKVKFDNGREGLFLVCDLKKLS